MANHLQLRQNGAGSAFLTLLLLGGAGTAGVYFLGKSNALKSVRSMLINLGVNPLDVRIEHVTRTTERSYIDESGTSHPAPQFRSWIVQWATPGQGGLALALANGTVTILRD